MFEATLFVCTNTMNLWQAFGIVTTRGYILDFEGQAGGNSDAADATWLWDVQERGKKEFKDNPLAKNLYTFFKDEKICFGLDGGFKHPTHGTAQEFDVFEIRHSNVKVCAFIVQLNCPGSPNSILIQRLLVNTKSNSCQLD